MAGFRDAASLAVNRVHRGVFTATKGKVGGRIGSRLEVMILTTTGRKTFETRTSMVTSPINSDTQVIVVAAYAGAPTHPQWYLNLLADPHVHLTRGAATSAWIARVATTTEREELWPRIVERSKQYAKYQAKTERELPVVIFDRR